MTAGAWTAFWRGNGGQGCLPNAPALHARLDAIWTDTARAVPRDGQLLDIAAGNGSVARVIATVAAGVRVTGIDYAEVGPGATRLGVRGGIDATALPFADAGFDGVVSQFGIEYCAPAALAEAARVLRPGGALRFVCHRAASPAIVHNAARLAALRALQRAGLFDLAAEVARGRPENPRQAAAVADVRRRHAGQTISEELPLALGQALRRPDAQRGVGAIATMANAEAARLAAMVVAALDDDAANAMTRRLAGAGVTATATPLSVATEAEPFAWLIDGRHI